MLSIIIAKPGEHLPRPVTSPEWALPQNRSTEIARHHWAYYAARAEVRRHVVELRKLRSSPNFTDPNFAAWCARQELLRLEVIRREFRTRPAAARATQRRLARTQAGVFATMVPWSENRSPLGPKGI